MKHLVLITVLLIFPGCDESLIQGSGSIPPPEAQVFNGIYNSGFEWIADSTTQPAKYGAYWPGAFIYQEGDSTDLIEEGAAFRGDRFLRLHPTDQEVRQKIVADPRWTDRFSLILAVRLEGSALLEVTLEDGPGQTITALLKKTKDAAVKARWQKGETPFTGIDCQPSESDWTQVRLAMGARFAAQHGRKPIPRLNVHLRCTGPEEARADIDEVYGPVWWPRIGAENLSRYAVERILWLLDTWFLSPAEGGLQLVDPDTGFVRIAACNVESGENRKPRNMATPHTIHRVLTAWLRHCRKQNWVEEVEAWTPHLERYIRSFLDCCFDEKTHLPRSYDLKTGRPRADQAVTVGAYLDTLLEAEEVISDSELKNRCLERARNCADTLIRLRQQHDRPGEGLKNKLQYDRTKNLFTGETRHWFGRLPKNLTPKGEIGPARCFNTAWAILTGKDHWYHYFKSAVSMAALGIHRPGPKDRATIERVLSLYHRDWDAERYDLENDTDDHYGYLTEDLTRLLRVSEIPYPEAIRLLREATDHRLERKTGRLEDSRWIQAVRLGTACAGDSPRAMKGVLDLHELPSLGSPIYPPALLELAFNDLKGRQLSNSQFTQSFFKNWEMTCICYRGTYQGDCREQPESYWHGDVGDTFGGPPTSGINALNHAYRLASPGEKQQIRSALGIYRYVTDRDLARTHGYLYGLDPAIAKQYELPEKYRMGLSAESAAGIGYVHSWLKLLPHLDPNQDFPVPAAAVVEAVPGRVKIRVTGPANGLVALPIYSGKNRPFASPLVAGERLTLGDLRMSAFPLNPGWQAACFRLDVQGVTEKEFPLETTPCCLVQPILLNPEGGAPLAIGEVLQVH